MQLLSAVKDLGRWRPTDDIMLISAVLQVLETVPYILIYGYDHMPNNIIRPTI